MQKEKQNCMICTEPVEIYSYGKCDHPSCHLCMLRIRALYDRKECPFCKTELETVVMRKEAADRPFATLQMADMHRDKKLSIYCETKDIYAELITLLRFNCPAKDCDIAVNNWQELKDHVRKKHQRFLCDVCVRHKKVFAHEHQLFTQKSLQTHMTSGDSEDLSFRGHPECRFCEQFFYSADELFEHCREKHEECHLCRRAGIRDQYFRDYNSLEEHFGREHFACKEASCLERKFVVFDNELDLRAHMSTEHSARMSKSEQKQVRTIDISSFQQQQQQQHGYQSSPRRGITQVGSSSSNNSVVNRNRMAFGAKLSSSNARSSSDSNNSANDLSEQTGKLSIEENQQKAIPKISLNVSSIFGETTDSELAKMISSPDISKAEKDLAPIIADVLNHDPNKWLQFRSLCLNYLQSIILAEKFLEVLIRLLGDGEVKKLFPRLQKIFPEAKRVILVRVYNDRNLRDRQTSNFSSETITAISPAEDSELRAKLMVIKSSARGSVNQGRDISAKPWAHAVNPASSTALDPELFPSLPTVSKSSNNHNTAKKTSSKKEAPLLSTSAVLRPAISSSYTSSSGSTSKPSKTSYSSIASSTSASNLAKSSSSSSINRVIKEEEFPSLPTARKPRSTWVASKSRSQQQDLASMGSSWTSNNSINNDNEQTTEDTKNGKKKKKVLLRFG